MRGNRWPAPIRAMVSHPQDPPPARRCHIHIDSLFGTIYFGRLRVSKKRVASCRVLVDFDLLIFESETSAALNQLSQPEIMAKPFPHPADSTSTIFASSLSNRSPMDIPTVQKTWRIKLCRSRSFLCTNNPPTRYLQNLGHMLNNTVQEAIQLYPRRFRLPSSTFPVACAECIAKLIILLYITTSAPKMYHYHICTSCWDWSASSAVGS